MVGRLTMKKQDKRIAELEAEMALMVPKSEYDEAAGHYDALMITFTELERKNARLREELAEMLNDWLDGVPITDEQAEYTRNRIEELEGE